MIDKTVDRMVETRSLGPRRLSARHPVTLGVRPDI